MKVKQLLASIVLLILLVYCAYTFVPAFISKLTYHVSNTDSQQVQQAFNNMQFTFTVIFGLVSLLILVGILLVIYMLVDSFHPLPTKEKQKRK